MNAKKLMSDLKRTKAQDNGKVILYLNKPDLNELKRICEQQGISASAVLREMIKEFIESAKGKK